MRAPLFFALLCAAATACGGDDDGGQTPVADAGPGLPDASDDQPDSGGPIGDSGWQAEQVTKLPDSATYEGTLAFDDAGTLWMAFTSTEFDTSSNQDVFTMSRVDGGWSAPEARHMPSDFQFTYPTMVADGGDLHLLMTGRFAGPDANNLYYAGYAGGAWSEAEALTEGAPGDGHGYYHAVLAQGAGERAAAYLFDGDVTLQPAEVLVATLDGGAFVEPVTAIDAGGCYDPAIAIDAAGVRHVVGACGSINALQLYYTNDAGGSFAEPVIIAESTSYNTGPILRVGADGETLHMAWQRIEPCGASSCSGIVYATRTGGAWSEPVDVDGGSLTFENSPTLAVAADGTRYVAYQRDDDGGVADVYVASSADGVSWDEVLLTPNTESTHQIAPRSLIVDPATGQPHLTFQDTTALDPYNTEIWHAWLEEDALR